MLRKNVLIGAAACAALSVAGFVHADVASPAGPTNYSNVILLDDPTTMPMTPVMPTSEPTKGPMSPMEVPSSAPAATSPATAVTPLNGALANIPHWADLGISASGYVEGSWTYTAHTVGSNILNDRVFDTKAESLQFDAINLLLARAADATKPFDFGFTFENFYGTDSAYIHSGGLAFVSNGKYSIAGVAAIHPKAQYDLNQADFILSFGKIGNGLSIEGGKFDTLLGYEVIDAPTNQFFSHSFIFDEEPFTHTGLLGIYNLTDPSGNFPLTITGGFTRGWDQATEDTNGSLDYTGQIKYTVPNSKGYLALTGITGDEQPSGAQDGWRTVIDATGNYSFSDQFSMGFNGMFAWQAQASEHGLGGGTGIWYGAAVYAKYVCCDYITFNARAEWFDDQDGAAPTQLSASPSYLVGGNLNAANQFYEVTLGATIKPAPNNAYLSGLAIRPEFRWDYSDHAAFNEGTQNDQWTFGVDAYYAF